VAEEKEPFGPRLHEKVLGYLVRLCAA